MTITTLATEVLLSAFSASSFNWALQEGTAAGQTVHHLHFHLIPRYEEDLPDAGDWYPKLERHMYSERIDSEQRPKLTESQQKNIVGNLRQEASKLFGSHHVSDFSG